LKFYTRHGRFPRGRAELPDEVVSFVARHAERRPDRVREEFLARCREEMIELPAPGRITRIVRSALHAAEEVWSVRISARLSRDATAAVRALDRRGRRLASRTGSAGGDGDDDDPDVLALIKSATGNVSLESMVTEIGKLEAVRAIGFRRPPEGKVGCTLRYVAHDAFHRREDRQDLNL